MAQDKNSPSNSNPSEIYEQVFIPAIMRHWTPILLEFAQPRAGEHILGPGLRYRDRCQECS
jgi:hypothetical protein